MRHVYSGMRSLAILVRAASIATAVRHVDCRAGETERIARTFGRRDRDGTGCIRPRSRRRTRRPVGRRACPGPVARRLASGPRGSGSGETPRQAGAPSARVSGLEFVRSAADDPVVMVHRSGWAGGTVAGDEAVHRGRRAAASSGQQRSSTGATIRSRKRRRRCSPVVVSR